MALTKITSSVIGDEFTSSSALFAAPTEDIDWTSAQIFTLTPTSNITLNITNPVIGISKAIIVTGGGGSYTITLNVDGVSGTFNKIAGDYNDAAGTKNLFQIMCVGTTEFWYTISQTS